VDHVAIAQENFTGNGVEITGAMPIAAQDDLSRLVTDLTRGKSVIKFDD
jgi:putative IMPACT (imprinted ancient) family translation regulator